MKGRIAQTLATGVGAAVLIACSTAKPPDPLTASPVASRAQPSGPYYLELADDEIARAQRLVADGKEDFAYNLLVRAEADAELASATARQTTDKTQAEAAIRRAQQMRSGL